MPCTDAQIAHLPFFGVLRGDIQSRNQSASAFLWCFEGALLDAYGYKKLEGRSWQEFDRWMASAKPHRSLIDAFREFERCFSQLSKRDRRSMEADKVLLFLKMVHQEERMDILFELGDDYGAQGLMRIGSKWNGYTDDMMRCGQP